MTDLNINRRRMLVAVAGTGAATFLGLGIATEDAVRYTKASSQSCDDYTLNAEWRETYTRDSQTRLLEDTTSDKGTEGSDPAIIHLSDMLPGDRGTVGFKLTADKIDDGASDTVTPTLGLVLNETAENDINDPERQAGDSSAGTGELQNQLRVKLWKNEGFLGIDELGGDNLEQDLGEPTIAEGTLAGVAQTLNDESLGTIDATTDESVSVTLRLEFTNTPNINVAQTDSVTFTLDIDCE